MQKRKLPYEIIKLNRDYIDNLPPIEFDENSVDYKNLCRDNKSSCKKNN